MRVPPTPCTNCNSPQRFSPRVREVEGAVEIYIRCRMCREETVLERHPAAQLEFIQRRMRRRRTALSRRPPR